MGYMFVVCWCVNCHTTIAVNPHHVPSIMVDGRREPLCRTCAERWNKMHPEAARSIHPRAYEAEEVE